METPVCVAGSQACGVIVYPNLPRSNLPRSIFSLHVSSRIADVAPMYQLQPRDCGSLLALPGPRKGCFMPIVQMGHQGLPRLVFLSLFLALSGWQALLITWPCG